ncbi:MAG: AAA family ATPase [Pseudomonadota bacterium]
MIFVERNVTPLRWAGEVVGKLPVAEAFFAQSLDRRRRRAFDFQALISEGLRQELRSVLLKLFHCKCAYCESTLSDSSAYLDVFRPSSGVAETSGDFLQDHYWRQAFEWENYYISCGSCTRNKANRFPVEGHRAAPNADRTGIASELALLVDPCADAPDEHLLFGDDGRVSGATSRGIATIEVFNLNRIQLVAERRNEARRFLADGSLRSEYLEAGAPFLALKRQLATRSIQDEATRAAAQAAQELHDASRETVATDAGIGLENYRSRARYVERILIENIGSIGKLELDLAAAESGTVPCFALLGINGVGKTTVLKSVALALSGKKYAKQLKLSGRRLLRNGEKEGRVTVHVSGYSEPIIMNVRAGHALEFNTDDARALVLGYGSTRLLPNGRHKAPVGMSHANVENLFDPFRPLRAPESWLSGLEGQLFDDAVTAIGSLLPDEDAALFERMAADRDVSVRVGSDAPLSLRQLSDGYQSLIGLAADVMDVMHQQGFKSMKSAQGIVLIDELGNHFHPRWKMRIVGALRRAFPQVQFIFSTHDPLCLRGLGQGEMAVLRRGMERNVYAVEDLPSVEGMRVDQLLTSEHFGLDTTLDPAAEQDLKRYRQLSVSRHRAADEEVELEKLVTKLSQARLVASTRRERLLLELIDRDEQEHSLEADQSVRAVEASAATLERLRRLVGAMNGLTDP